MLILVKNKALISGCNADEIYNIQRYLTIDNPLFNQRVELGLGNWNVPSKLVYYEYDYDLQQITVPVGALPDLIGKNIISPDPEDILDLRTVGESPQFFSKLNFSGTLRDYQQEIINACADKTMGVIEAMTGSGKTATFISLVMQRKLCTLILVNTIELANQTKEAFLKFTNATPDDIGFIGSGKFKLTPICICLHQTMAKAGDEVFKLLNTYYGMVIADEIHIISARTYSETMGKLQAKYKFGFSATPKRDDGLTPVIHFVTGPKIHTVPKSALTEHLITPSIVFKETEYYYPLLSTQEYQEMISDLSSNHKRNKLIVDTLNNEYLYNNVILLCTRIEQVNQLTEAIGDSAVSLTSDMTKKARAQAIADLNSRVKKHVVSTYGLFSTGIDIPHLDTLFLCAPVKSEIKIRQSAGRLMRKSPGKTKATIVDFVDKQIELLKYQAAKRKRILNAI